MSELELFEAYNHIMIADALALLDFLQKNKTKYTTLDALVDATGRRIEGSEKIIVDKIPSASNPTAVWFYRVRPVKDYVFMPIPVTVCYIDYATKADTQNPDSEVFRFVNNPMATFTEGGMPNLLVNFSVIGYKPKQLLGRLKV